MATGKSSLGLLIAAFALAALVLQSFAETDVYGNEIFQYTEGGVQKTYQFWVSGDKAEVATKARSSSSASSCTALATGTYSKPAAQPISLEARFRTWLKSIGTSLRSDKFGGFLFIVY